jgi:hypothetical protein
MRVIAKIRCKQILKFRYFQYSKNSDKIQNILKILKNNKNPQKFYLFHDTKKITKIPLIFPKKLKSKVHQKSQSPR